MSSEYSSAVESSSLYIIFISLFLFSFWDRWWAVRNSILPHSLVAKFCDRKIMVRLDSSTELSIWVRIHSPASQSLTWIHILYELSSFSTLFINWLTTKALSWWEKLTEASYSLCLLNFSSLTHRHRFLEYSQALMSSWYLIYSIVVIDINAVTRNNVSNVGQEKLITDLFVLCQKFSSDSVISETLERMNNNRSLLWAQQSHFQRLFFKLSLTYDEFV